MNFCSDCGSSVELKIPKGEQRQRYVCISCKKVHYINPKIIVGCLPIYDKQILLCRRAIEPRRGLWTLPAGFLEVGESIMDGAMRETYEEAGAKVNIKKMYTLFNMINVQQVTIFFLAQMVNSKFFIGEESLDVQFFHESKIPWDNMAFNTSFKTLKYYFEERVKNKFKFHHEVC